MIADEMGVRRSGSLAELSAALAAAQAEMKNPQKDSVNPHYKSRYADLATVRDAVLPCLNRHGLSVLQLPCELPCGPALVTLLLHKSGEWVESSLALRPQQMTPQGIGSALTYCRRYALQSLAGVAADDDDDGHAAGKPRHQPAAEPAKKPPAAPKGDGIDRSVDRATIAAAAPKPGDPVTDSKAIVALVLRKGYDWPRLIGDLNARYKTTYSVTGTVWRDVAHAHREAAVAQLHKLPDRDSADDLNRLCERLALSEAVDPVAVFIRYASAANLPEGCITSDDMTAAQLATACKAFRAKLDAAD